MKHEHLPVEALNPFARLYSVSLHGVTFGKLRAEDGTDKGGAIIATQDRKSENNESPEEDILIKVPADLILSLEMVQDRAKYDRHLREVLEATQDFGKTARGAILTFLLTQISHSSPDFEGKSKIGSADAWTEYVKFLPSFIPLPTFWTMEELELLRGTSLRLAYEAKITALEKEFEHFRQTTEEIKWCQDLWWDENTRAVTFEDWKYLDAVFRSRMVDLPGCGHAMVPCIDMANHAPESAVNAFYGKDADGNAILQLHLGKQLRSGEEVTISYGQDKSAAEMVFSYGFLDAERNDTKQIQLDLDIPDDDPLGMAKMAFCKEIPGLRVFAISTASGELETYWESPIVWWASVNEEDGLGFAVLQANDGSKELKINWKVEDVKTPHQLRDLLAVDPSWEIFQLRAVVLVLERLETQLFILNTTEGMVSDIRESKDMRALFRPQVFNTVTKLRSMEGRLLATAIRNLEKQRDDLMKSETVRTYLAQQQSAEVEDDFA
ncbi:SET domain-containing protein [Aspergillus lucknowensis]|uniref:SET domain-containing protein n=1 Tax=Aspergillus lucknowensis TaxID=176173 RepID=A0ABR4LXW9_9EURO